MATAQALENNGGEWGLTWYLWWGIYKTIPTWTHLQNPVAAVEVEALISKISSKKNISLMIEKINPVRMRIIIVCDMTQGIPFWVWGKVNWNWHNNMSRISQWRDRQYRTNTRVRRNKSIQKGRTVTVTAWDPRRTVNHLSKVVW